MRWFDPILRRIRCRPHNQRAQRRQRSAHLQLEALETRAVPCVTDSALAFVGKAYGDLLQRPLDAVGQEFFGNALDRGTSFLDVARGILTSQEFRANAIQGSFATFLNRPADAGSQNFFLGSFGAGATLEQIQAHIAGSAEYFQSQGGGTTDGFLDALFSDALIRAPDAFGRAFFTQRLATGTTRAQVAEMIFASDEYRAKLVQGFYQQFLNRPADTGGQQFFVGLLQRGARTEEVIANLVASDEYAPGASRSGNIILSACDVDILLQRAAAASASNDAIITIADRNGRILGIRIESQVSSAILNNLGSEVYAIDGSLAKARTAAFFANNTAPLTSRTVQFISQTTITQREVESNPSLGDSSSVWQGPGFVAPVGLGGHFPPGVANTPPVDLFAIEHTNRDTSTQTGLADTFTQDKPTGTVGRFNAPRQFVPPGQELTPPDSYGVVSGRLLTALPRGIATLPGGIPIYKYGEMVGGIGVFLPGVTGTATEENSILSATYNPSRTDRSFEGEYIAFAAVGGSAGFGFPIGPLDGVRLPPGLGDLPAGRIDLAGITLDLFGPGGDQGPQRLFAFGQALGTGSRVSGFNQAIVPNGTQLRDGKPVPAGWLVTPHDGVGISAADVTQMVNHGIAEARIVRAQIRLPLGNRTRMVFAVGDTTGAILGLFRMPDATVFSIGVAVAKARNVAYYNNPAQLQAADRLPGFVSGVAFTSRTFRYLAQPRFPEGIDGTPPAFFSILRDGGVNPLNGLQVGPRLPASAFQSELGFDAFNASTNFRAPTDPRNQNGVVFFPGSSSVYRDTDGNLVPDLVGGLGVSGDGVDQDDLITSAAVTGFGPQAILRADQYFFLAVRLPYFKFPRNPLA